MSSTLHPQIVTRKAVAAEAEAVTDTLAAAFFDDPVIGWALSDDARRRELLPRVFRLFVEGSLAFDEAYTTDDLDAAALWIPPEGIEVSEAEAAAFAAETVAAAAEFGDAVLALFEALDAHHPHDKPHCYLPIIGARPGRQGAGLGSALLASRLARCDQEGMAAYLEATSERNQRLYLRHGFEVMEEARLPDGPPVWHMWREPRTS